MEHLPETLLAWRTAAQWDAAALARKWLAAVATMPTETRRAVLAHVPDEADLVAAWEASAKSSGPLAGIPVLVKDLYDVAGWETTASSTFLPEVRPTPTRDSAMVTALREAGAVIVGKTHLNEFAYGLSGENAHYGDVPCPADPTRLSGGSSSGSAWSVGAGLVPFAIGTDTGGSVRVPASYCGIWGLRLTPDHPLSHDGCFPLSKTFDTGGWFAPTASELTEITTGLLGEADEVDRPLKALRLADPYAYGEAVESAYAQTDWPFAVDSMEAGLAEQWLRDIPELASPFSIIQSHEALSYHEAWFDRFAERYDPRTYQRIERARHWTPEQLQQAQETKVTFRAWFTEHVFAHYDFALLPAIPCVAQPPENQAEPLRSQVLRMTTPASFYGCPVIARPIPGPENLTLGWQVMAKDVPTAQRALALFAEA